MAIPIILPGDRDVIVAASTASGKTEAAFLPALTNLLSRPIPGLIVYISPFKALINDQFGRLDLLCDSLEIPVWAWHGDVSSTSKARFLRSPSGVLLITPESLEALLCNRGTSVASLFARTSYFIVDELHAFIGSERGKQLQSLMHRIEAVLKRRVSRIGLSATLGDIKLAAKFLRDDPGVAIIDAPGTGASLQLLIKGFEETAPENKAGCKDIKTDRAPLEIARHLFQKTRGSNNMVFPNSRREVERYTHLLNEICDEERIPHEFWPHHGSLSKEIRYDTEAALKKNDRSANAVCTSTLELGIDIGAVRSVAQIGVPPSVGSLRQRLGRSGRREGESAILRGYLTEDALTGQAGLATTLRVTTFQTAAAVALLLENWFEPPVTHGAHLSTLIQQLLSAIAQYGGLQAAECYGLLCSPSAPFNAVSKEAFADLLRHLGSQEVLVQDASGLLLHGAKGDKFVNHYSFYAAFDTEEEFRIIASGKVLGTLPISQMLTPGQRILFGGNTWLVEEIDESKKAIHVLAGSGGAPPLFSGTGGRVHTKVRKRMRELYASTQPVQFLDKTAQRFLEEGREGYRRLDLDRRLILEQGNHALLLTWLGDSANEALACLLTSNGLKASADRLGVEITGSRKSDAEIRQVLSIIGSAAAPPLDRLLEGASNLIRQKWDSLLSPPLLRLTFASLNLDLVEAMEWIRAVDGSVRSDPQSSWQG